MKLKLFFWLLGSIGVSGLISLILFGSSLPQLRISFPNEEGLLNLKLNVKSSHPKEIKYRFENVAPSNMRICASNLEVSVNFSSKGDIVCYVPTNLENSIPVMVNLSP